MPTTTPPSDRLTPRSVLRHRPIGTRSRLENPPSVARASRSASGTHTQRHQQTQRRSQAVARTTTASVDVPVVPVWKQGVHPSASASRASGSLVLPMVLGMLLAMIVVLVGQLLIGWVDNLWNELQYGSPRTYQVDEVVGHHDSIAHPSHFLAFNLHGQIEVIELPGGDVSRAKVYVVARLAGPQADLVPVILHFVPNQQTHELDMVVSFGGEQVVYRNGQGAFDPPISERVSELAA